MIAHSLALEDNETGGHAAIVMYNPRTGAEAEITAARGAGRSSPRSTRSARMDACCLLLHRPLSPRPQPWVRTWNTSSRCTSRCQSKVTFISTNCGSTVNFTWSGAGDDRVDALLEAVAATTGQSDEIPNN